jgi:hypothetical protein
MKRISIALVFLLIVTFSACATGIKYNLPPGGTVVPSADISVRATLTPMPVPPSLPVSSTSQKIYLDPIIGIQFSYPDTWYLQDFTESQSAAVIVTSFDPANPPHKLVWTNQTISMQFRLLTGGFVPQNLDSWVESAKQAATAGHLSIFEEERLLIANVS